MPIARERIVAALDGRAADVELVEVRDEAEATRRGMTGSPTVLIDGVDPFAPAGAVPSVSCRLYRDADGRTEGAPSVQALRRALVGLPVGPPGGADERECRDAGVPDPSGRGGRGRRAPAEGGLRAVQQAVLGCFAATGRAPEAAELEAVAATCGRTAGEVLAELDREDFLALDGDGRIRAAYPFSAVPTAHRVRIAGGTEVWSMCAIDALGIATMLGTDVVISSADPVTGDPIVVSDSPDGAVWQPPSAVVFIGHRGRSGPAASVCCDALNFFTGEASARRWADEHPEVTGDVVGRARAEDIGRRTFGPLLSDG
ncbi:alkylmercury lyase family protein [Embleya sp. NPDC059259]|uniref:alkylmercury lyase family protein n=1 Tax=Embleya sp. NPDC059259 TaxID=3346796 RepID=UPI0036A9D9A5